MIKTNYNRDELVHYKVDDDGISALLNLLHRECFTNGIFLYGVFCKHDNMIEDGFSETNNQNSKILYTEGDIFRLDSLVKKQFNNRQYASRTLGKFSLYVVGSSTTFQPFLNFSDSLHQRMLNINSNIKYCESLGLPHRFGERVTVIKTIKKIREGIIKKGDVVVFLRDGGIKDHSHLVSTTSMLKHEVTFDRQSLFFDDMGHLSETGIRRLSDSINLIVAQKIVKVHNEAADLSLAEKTIFEINNLLKEKSFEFDDSFTEFQNYLCQFKRKKTDRCGSILVNCNPITLGHQHLIDTACSNVDHLFLFVIESEKSEFSFEDRFNMVQLNYRDNKKVTVLKGGKFMCSEYIIPEYFNKDNHNGPEHVKGLEFESFCFGRKIAPILNIKDIWLGDEPNCNLTRYYNTFMQHAMPEYGINVNIIERILVDNRPISASSVRKNINEKEYTKVKALVSEKTYAYLEKLQLVTG